MRQAAEGPPGSSRRREPRVEPSDRVRVRCIGPWDVEVVALRDLSFGGFGIESTHNVPQGILTNFEFQAPDTFTATLPARSVYSRSLPIVGGKPIHYVSGWEFLGDRDHRPAIQHLIDASKPKSPSK